MRGTVQIFKPLVFLACLLPLLWLAWRGWQGSLGANPIEMVTRDTGIWTLRLLLLTLTVTPLRKVSGWNGVIRVRRMLGLFVFFYASLHLLTYLWLDQFFLWEEIWFDIQERPFITAGFATFLLLLPLALSSPKAVMRWLGGKRWQQLHRLVYVAAVTGVVHYWWLVKADVRSPQLYALLLVVLLAFR
ncbi:MAG TPA: sulfoxide reductase heme-binding subunit YedZ, partial [Gammaproteobacteria bacterium]|nr:sulfoxide reductase heme-binding subunit YedZ [Gammaproteobacteria bacterium]